MTNSIIPRYLTNEELESYYDTYIEDITEKSSQLVRDLFSKENTFITKEVSKEFHRFAKVTEYLANRLKNSSLFLTSQNTLDTISNIVRTMEGEIKDLPLEELKPYLSKQTEKMLAQIPFLASKEYINSTATDLRKLIDTSIEEIEKLTTNLETEQNAIRETRERYEELINVAAQRALSNEYDLRARSEKAASEKWTKFTWLFASLAISTVLIGFFYQAWIAGSDSSQMTRGDVQFLGTKILLAVTLGVIARWASKRAQRHLAEEAKYHRLAVNIATLDDFIRDIDEPKRIEIKTAVAIKIFTDVSGNDAPTDYDGAAVGDILAKLIGKDTK